MEVSFRVLFWVTNTGDKSSQRLDIELAKKRLRMTEVD